MYNNSSLLPHKINPNILPKTLLTCTTEVPFYDHLGYTYTQKDSVSMESVLGPIFRNFYMSDLEKKFDKIKKPSIYQRYVDDILILAYDTNEMNILEDIFPKISVHNFIHELNKNNKISFLDILNETNKNNNSFTPSSYPPPLITIPVRSTLKVNAPSDL